MQCGAWCAGARFQQVRRVSENSFFNTPPNSPPRMTDADVATAFFAALGIDGDAASPPSFDALALRGLTAVNADAAAGTLTARLPLRADLTNRYGTLHGGAAATIVDVVSSAAIVLTGSDGGVSVTLDVTYLSPAPLAVGHVLAAARVRRVGRSLAVADVDITLPDGVTVVATGRHVKHVAAGRHVPRAKL